MRKQTDKFLCGDKTESPENEISLKDSYRLSQGNPEKLSSVIISPLCSPPYHHTHIEHGEKKKNRSKKEETHQFCVEMLLRYSIEKTKNLFNKTLVNLKSFFFGGYQRLPKPPSFHPVSCGSSRQEDPQIEKFHADFCNEWEGDLDKGRTRTQKDAKEQVKDGEDPCSDTAMKHVNHQSPVKNKQQEVEGERGKTEKKKKKKKKKVGGSKSLKTEETDGVNAGGLVLAKRMKELEMMDLSDMDHVLDIEEALHYYSRLKSPVYVEIVDKFFMDMYSDFSPTPQQHRLSTTTKSKKRLGSGRF